MVSIISQLLAVPYQDVLLLMRAPVVDDQRPIQPTGDRDTWKTFYNVAHLPDLLQDVGHRRRWRRPRASIRSEFSRHCTPSSPANSDVAVYRSTRASLGGAAGISSPEQSVHPDSIIFRRAQNHRTRNNTAYRSATSPASPRLVSASPRVTLSVAGDDSDGRHVVNGYDESSSNDIRMVGRHLRQIADHLHRSNVLRHHHHHHRRLHHHRQHCRTLTFGNFGRSLIPKEWCLRWRQVAWSFFLAAAVYQLGRNLSLVLN